MYATGTPKTLQEHKSAGPSFINHCTPRYLSIPLYWAEAHLSLFFHTSIHHCRLIRRARGVHRRHRRSLRATDTYGLYRNSRPAKTYIASAMETEAYSMQETTGFSYENIWLPKAGLPSPVRGDRQSCRLSLQPQRNAPHSMAQDLIEFLIS